MVSISDSFIIDDEADYDKKLETLRSKIEMCGGFKRGDVVHFTYNVPAAWPPAGTPPFYIDAGDRIPSGSGR
jgi:hypothetical protein